MMRRSGIAAAVVLCGIGQATAGPINPFDPGLSPMGAFTTSGSNTVYTINTSGTPTLTRPDGSTINGVVFADTPGHNLAVFDFAAINIVAGTTIRATGALPLVLLSRGDVTIAGVIDASA